MSCLHGVGGQTDGQRTEMLVMCVSKRRDGPRRGARERVIVTRSQHVVRTSAAWTGAVGMCGGSATKVVAVPRMLATE